MKSISHLVQKKMISSMLLFVDLGRESILNKDLLKVIEKFV